MQAYPSLAEEGLTDLTDDPAPMRRAVAFCQTCLMLT